MTVVSSLFYFKKYQDSVSWLVKWAASIELVPQAQVYFFVKYGTTQLYNMVIYAADVGRETTR